MPETASTYYYNTIATCIWFFFSTAKNRLRLYYNIVDGQPDRARCVYTVCNYGAICKFNGPRRATRRLDYIVVYGYGVGGGGRRLISRRLEYINDAIQIYLSGGSGKRRIGIY